MNRGHEVPHRSNVVTADSVFEGVAHRQFSGPGEDVAQLVDIFLRANANARVVSRVTVRCTSYVLVRVEP